MEDSKEMARLWEEAREKVKASISDEECIEILERFRYDYCHEAINAISIDDKDKYHRLELAVEKCIDLFEAKSILKTIISKHRAVYIQNVMEEIDHNQDLRKLFNI